MEEGSALGTDGRWLEYALALERGCLVANSCGWHSRRRNDPKRTRAEEDDAVPGRVATVPFDLGIGNCNTRSIVDVRATEWCVVTRVGDDGDVLIALHP